jgi:hypothetical protein
VLTILRSCRPADTPHRHTPSSTSHPLEQRRCTPVSPTLVRRGQSLWGIICPILIINGTACVRRPCALCHATMTLAQRLWPQLSRRRPFTSLPSQPNVPGPGVVLRILAVTLLKPSKRPSRNCVEERLHGLVTERFVHIASLVLSRRMPLLLTRSAYRKTTWEMKVTRTGMALATTF